MQESMTMAEVGSIVKVSGSRIATPFGPPRPGSTPTKMPSTRPTIIKASVLNVNRTSKPCSRRPRASMLVTEQGFDRPLWHQDVKGDVEGDEHGERKDETRQQRLPPRDAPDDAHKARDQQEARDVQPEPLGGETKEARGNEHLHHAAKLVAVDEDPLRSGTLEEGLEEAVETRTAEDHGKIEREVARLRAVRRPAHAGAPVVEGHQSGERNQQQRDNDIDRARVRDPGRVLRGRVRIFDDDFFFRFGHRFWKKLRTLRCRPASVGRQALLLRHDQLATKPASVIRFLFSVSSSSRNFSMSEPVRKIGFSACFSM